MVVMRLMGKRQLGEMQPFELVITLIIAEVACIPMNDPYIPFYYGLIPIVTLATLSVVLSLISRKSMRARRLLAGKSMLAIDKDGINYENMKKMNLNMDDLIETTKTNGYPDLSQIAYAIVETNGKISVVEKPQLKPTNSETEKDALMPIPLFVDGYWENENLRKAGVKKETIENAFKERGFSNSKKILYADIRQDGVLFISPKNEKDFILTLEIEGGQNW